MPGYRQQATGADGLARKIADLQRQIDSLRSAAGLHSAVIGSGGLTVYNPVTGVRMFLGEGQLKFWGDYANNPDGNGRISTDPGSLNLLRIHPPYERYEGRFNNGITMQGPTDIDSGTIWVRTDGVLSILTEDENDVPVGEVHITSPSIWLNSANLRLYSLPTTGSAANLRLETGTGIPIVHWVTSSRRYKQDIQPARVEPREVLQLQPRTWVDKGAAERFAEESNGEQPTRNVGFIAEELDELPSMRQFVDYDADGRPDAIQYDRLSVALLALAKNQEERLTSQQSQIDALTKRFDSLEAT